jgi:hypothetical protein
MHTQTISPALQNATILAENDFATNIAETRTAIEALTTRILDGKLSIKELSDEIEMWVDRFEFNTHHPADVPVDWDATRPAHTQRCECVQVRRELVNWSKKLRYHLRSSR